MHLGTSYFQVKDGKLAQKFIKYEACVGCELALSFYLIYLSKIKDK